MLKKRKSTKYIILSIVVMLSITIALLSGVQPYNTVRNTPTTPMADATLNTNYSAFEDGSTYMYTDLSKVETAHNDPTQSDTSTIVVDREQNHGSLQNPYVINTLAQWNYFATNSSSGATDANKVFVLGQDIDFSGQTYNAIANFAGKFYGGGHTLSNISKNFGSDNQCGVFRVISDGSIIADINIDNVSILSSGGRVGALVGSTNGGDILNCHVKGDVTGTSNYVAVGGSAQNSGEHYAVGGLIGDAGGSNVKIYVYRCSVNVKITANMAAVGASGGGIFGGFSCKDSTLATSVYDCLVIADLTVNGTGNNDIWFGGITNYVSFLGEQAIENCATYISVNNNT
ncbi:MAG: hypothetical protein K2H24_01630, partial [Clostridia bacterium]|nr:hypothetical protein [Clostridia bacterium]